MKNGICLTMIVKDESKFIANCLKSALPYCEYTVIHDTGSTDDTVDKIKSILPWPENNTKGAKRFFSSGHKWVNFSENRNATIADAKQLNAQWLLLLDGDEELVVTDKDWVSKLDPKQPGYNLEFAGDVRWSLPLLVNTDWDWKYRGACHEYIIAPKVDPSAMKKLAGVQVVHLEDGQRYPQKLKRNLDLLLAEHEENPLNERTLFYLANTYFDMGGKTGWASALEFYQKRIERGGWAEEVFYAMLRKAICVDNLGQNPIGDYLAAWNFRPTRVEPLLYGARWLRKREQYFAAYALTAQAHGITLPGDILFVNVNAHEWEAKLEHVAICIITGRCKEAIEVAAPLVGKPGPEKFREVAAQNLKTALSRV